MPYSVRSRPRCQASGARARKPVSHVGSSVPACSATMYAAYHSGQFSSASPMRFSCSPWAAAARRSALTKSPVDANAVPVASIRPGSRVVTSCISQPFPEDRHRGNRAPRVYYLTSRARSAAQRP